MIEDFGGSGGGSICYLSIEVNEEVVFEPIKRGEKGHSSLFEDGDSRVYPVNRAK